ncbi:GSCFA domain-containing protein [Pseudoalteromonas tunicata]|uniref:GSCFA domain-containing protein n=1 Tax=Pseudoalteromonas tunicata TaxID=314281 RepID=UPI00273D78CF|nr:GSCFA domain-containing protein [Pseudoalteromonas tunicata]MDP4984135.1 GSCFA domain-containing protein [Pseudoalteromonas tunicata]
MDFKHIDDLAEITLKNGKTISLRAKKYLYDDYHFEHKLSLGIVYSVAKKLYSGRQQALPYEPSILKGLDQQLLAQTTPFLVKDADNHAISFQTLESLLQPFLVNIIEAHFGSRFFVAGFRYITQQSAQDQLWSNQSLPQNSLNLYLKIPHQTSNNQDDVNPTLLSFLDRDNVDLLKYHGYLFDNDINNKVDDICEVLNYYDKKPTITKLELCFGEMIALNIHDACIKFSLNQSDTILCLSLLPSPIQWHEIYQLCKPPINQILVNGLYDFVASQYSHLIHQPEVCLIDKTNAIQTTAQLDFELHEIFSDPKVISYLAKNLSTLLAKNQIPDQFQFLGFIDDLLKLEINNMQFQSSIYKALWELAQFKEASQISTQKYRIDNTKIFWPNPGHAKYPRDIYGTFPFVTSHKFITPQTAVGSAGSCFAVEIAKYFQKNNFNYVVTEWIPQEYTGVMYDIFSAFDPFSAYSAQYGILFNTPSFTQLAQKAFNKRVFKKRLIWNPELNRLYDPYREGVDFSSPEAFYDDYPKHVEAVRQAFLQTEVFIITLGLNEAWQFRDGTFASRNPKANSYHLLQHRVLTVDENVQYLETFYAILKEYNPNIKIIVSVSPVPFLATGRGETHHVISANTHSKAVLRVAAEQFTSSHADAYYFPSFEMVTECIQDPWLSDLRHVKPEAVSQVMNLFEKMFVVGK